MNNSGKRTMTDLTKGDPLKVITLFALPLFLSNILQQLYNLTDIAIIGHVLGDDALSAIGSVSTIYGFYNSLFF
jgi:Na+-driven multidrug efflux pump